jgi:AcrR family transcriptional regulator
MVYTDRPALSTIRLVSYGGGMTDAAPRDSAATRQRLVQAAGEEFTAHGIAGARVDRIASAARANKAQIYHYFGDKIGLFDAVLETFTAEAVGAVAIDADDLPDYAARLFDYHFDHPQLLRLVTWARLEGRTTPPTQTQRTTSYERRAEAIAKAQEQGKITTAVPATQILDMIESLAVGWTTTARGLIADTRRLKRERKAYRAGIAEAVERIVRPG